MSKSAREVPPEVVRVSDARGGSKRHRLDRTGWGALQADQAL